MSLCFYIRQLLIRSTKRLITKMEGKSSYGIDKINSSFVKSDVDPVISISLGTGQ